MMAAQGCLTCHRVQVAAPLDCKPPLESRTLEGATACPVRSEATASDVRRRRNQIDLAGGGRGGSVPHSRALASSSSGLFTGGPLKQVRGQHCAQRVAGASRSRRPTRVTCMAFDVGNVSPVVLAGGLSVAGFGVLRAAIYFRLQYITAAMVARHVPRGGARLVDLSPKDAAGRNLFYLPKDAVQVTVFDGADKGAYLQELGVRAGVPVDVRSVPVARMNLPPASVDAVVSVYGLSATKDTAAVLREAVRVLKPGKPFIFVENVASENGLVRGLQAGLAAVHRATGWGQAPDRDSLRDVQVISEFEDVQAERIWDWQDPHVVGVAVKRAAPVTAQPKVSALEKQVDELPSRRRRKRGQAAT